MIMCAASRRRVSTAWEMSAPSAPSASMRATSRTINACPGPMAPVSITVRSNRPLRPASLRSLKLRATVPTTAPVAFA
ncbi:hypothetical protein D3C87_1626060 [compost metagenome]